ncbi:hypothetical protein BX666DRAFT_1987433 [Dichotomocladium elegans]|nr:hypothetical protein BX666DRAFT_1987433 [Dichotomocladium elegans]
MALVNYGSSDSESSDIESKAPSPRLAKTSTQKNSGGLSFASLLPPPKNDAAASASKIKTTSRSTPSKSVIFVDLPKAHESESDDDDEDKKLSKRQKTSTSGSLDLADLLPAPKRGYSLTRPKPSTAPSSTPVLPPPSPSPKHKVEASSSVITQHSSFRPQDHPEHQKKTPAKVEVDEDNEPVQHAGPFFHLGAELKSRPLYGTNVTKKKAPTVAAEPKRTKSQQKEPTKTQQQEQGQQHYMTAADAYAYSNTDVNAMYSYDPAQYYQYWQQYQQQQEGVDSTAQEAESSADPFANMDDATYTRLTGKRKQRESNINIKTVNQEDILPDAQWHERNKQLQAPKFISTAATFEASGLQRKKNNIMALAAQAQSMQERLNDQFASSRTTMQESRRKYGF